MKVQEDRGAADDKGTTAPAISDDDDDDHDELKGWEEEDEALEEAMGAVRLEGSGSNLLEARALCRSADGLLQTTESSFAFSLSDTDSESECGVSGCDGCDECVDEAGTESQPLPTLDEVEGGEESSHVRTCKQQQQQQPPLRRHREKEKRARPKPFKSDVRVAFV